MESKDLPVESNVNLQRDVTDLKDKCPAFEEKCPFDTPAAKELKELAKDCPAFKEGCVFENAKTIQDVYEQLSSIPDMANGSPHQKALVMILKLIHSVSSELKDKIGECPAFSSKQGCPFKTVCSDGKPMVEKLTDFNTESLVYESVIQASYFSTLVIPTHQMHPKKLQPLTDHDKSYTRLISKTVQGLSNVTDYHNLFLGFHLIFINFL